MYLLPLTLELGSIKSFEESLSPMFSKLIKLNRILSKEYNPLKLLTESPSLRFLLPLPAEVKLEIINSVKF